MKRHLPKILLDWSDRLDIYIKQRHGISPKQKALELHMDTVRNKRIDQNIINALEGKERSPRKEKKKKKKPK